MQIIKNKQIVNDTWHYVADNDHLVEGDITVSLPRFQQQKEELLARTSAIGVRLHSADPVSLLAADLASLSLIELYFSDFADGRAFSQAWLLRKRYSFTGEIRAVGQYCSDQLSYLSRVGVNAFSPLSNEDMAISVCKLNDFSQHYQTSADTL